jgi:hypothetical protein
MLAGQFGASQLAKVGGRLAITPANSVPSERSFSAMNYIQNNFRARMSTVITSRLCNVYMNCRVLDQRKGLITNDWIQQQIKRRVERHQNKQMANLADVKRAQQASMSLNDLIDEAAVIIPASKAALISFPEEADRILMPPPPAPEHVVLPEWVTRESGKQYPSKKQRKRKAPSEAPQTPRQRSQTPQLLTPQTQSQLSQLTRSTQGTPPTESTQSQYWAPAAPLRTLSPHPQPPSSQFSFLAGSSMPMPPQSPSQTQSQRTPLGVIDINSSQQYAQPREMYDLCSPRRSYQGPSLEFSQDSQFSP